MTAEDRAGPNTVERLRELLLQIYVSSSIRDDLPEAEAVRLLDAIVAAGEGEPFALPGLPFPRTTDGR